MIPKVKANSGNNDKMNTEKIERNNKGKLNIKSKSKTI